MWPGLVQTAKEGGADVIETYVFWNGHELSPNNVSRNKRCVVINNRCILCIYLIMLTLVCLFFYLNWEILVLFWGAIRSGQVCEDCSAGGFIFDSSNWAICCSRMELWVRYSHC